MITDYFKPVSPDTPGAILHNGQYYELEPLMASELFALLNESEDLEAVRASRDEWQEMATKLSGHVDEITKRLEKVQEETDSLKDYIDEIEGI